MRTRVAWSLAALTTLLVIANAVLTAQYLPLLSEAAVAVHGFPFIDLATLGSAVMGAVIIDRNDRHVIGWLLSLVGVSAALSLVTEAYAVWVIDHDGPGTMALAGPVGWVSTLLGGQLAITALAFLFLLAPDGNLLSPRWRYAVGVTTLGEGLTVLGMVGTDPRTFDLTSDTSSGGAVQALQSAGLLLISAGLLASLVSMLIRLRRSEGEQRRQLRLVALAAGAVSVGLVWLLVAQGVNGGRQTRAAQLPVFASFALLPVFLAVAALRYRLYDIEVIINRTVVLAAGTAFAAVGYTTLVVGAGKVVDRRTGGLGLSLAATVVVALAFQPLRRRVIRLANRLAFGPRAQPYEALSDFSRRLAETPSPPTLLSAVADAAGRAVPARAVLATMDLPGGDVVSATWGEPAPAAVAEHVVPVRDGEHTLGQIAVTLTRGHTLRPADGALLEALADQAAVVFRNSAMQAQLARHVADLARTTTELASSRSRIIEADDAVRRALSGAIARDVLPHMIAVSEHLARPLDGAGAADAGRGIEEMIVGVNTALASLRELTRGVFPTQLARTGLEPALRSLVDRSGQAATLQVEPSAQGRRFSARVEAAVYFCCAQAVGSGGAVRSVALAVTGDTLVHTVTGLAGDALDLQGISDRAEAVGGQITVEDDVLRLSIPLGAHPDPDSPARPGPHLH